jgi:glycosyltransferase involved in cell wall biosynthesis
MDNASITVITVTRNALGELRKTVSSVLSQEWSGIEHIVVDGQSDDGTRDYLSQINDPRFKWSSEPDSGIYDAMNKGMARASGDYLLFLNSGDFFVGQVLVPNMDLDRLLAVRTTNFWGRETFLRKRDLRLGMPYCHQGIIFRNQGLVPFDTSYRIAADYEFLIENLSLAGLKSPSRDGKAWVVFDSKGVSNTEYVKRDLEAGRIVRRRFGALWWLRFWMRQSARLVVRQAVGVLGIRFGASKFDV